MPDPGNYNEFFSEQNVAPVVAASGTLYFATTWAMVANTPTTLLGYGITDALTAAAAALAYQPVNGGLTAISALSTTVYGRALLTLADQAALQSAVGLTITTLGATTVGGNIFTLTNPGAITFLRLNANNTVTARSASDFRSDIGLTAAFQISGSAVFFQGDVSVDLGEFTVEAGDLVVTAGNITATAGTFNGNGSGLTNLNADNIASGTLPDARFPATLPAASGANLTALNASNLASGTVPAARLPNDLDIQNTSGANIASAGTINLETATGDCVDVTGTTTITAITLSEGHTRTVRFTGALTLTHGASLVLLGGKNIVTASGDFAIFRGYSGGVVRMLAFMSASTVLAVGDGDTGNPAENAVGSIDTVIGAVSTTTVLSTPNLFIPIIYNGSNYLIPAYAPTA